jgi:hypothetical protein
MTSRETTRIIVERSRGFQRGIDAIEICVGEDFGQMDGLTANGRRF